MSLKKYIREYQAIPNPIIISKFIKYLNKTFNENSFVRGNLWNGDKSFDDKTVRDVDTLALNCRSKSLSNVHWCNFLSHLIIKQMKNYIKEFPDVNRATIFDIQALRYGLGGHYKFHVDDGPGMVRKYSSILMLNNDYEGGELSFKLDGEIETIKPAPGKLIIWPSNFMYPHAVKPLRKGVRYSVVAWMN